MKKLAVFLVLGLLVAGCGGGASEVKTPVVATAPAAKSWDEVCPAIFDIWSQQGDYDAAYFDKAGDSISGLAEQSDNEVMPTLVALRDKALAASRAYSSTDPADQAYGVAGWYVGNKDASNACKQAGYPLA